MATARTTATTKGDTAEIEADVKIPLAEVRKPLYALPRRRRPRRREATDAARGVWHGGPQVLGPREPDPAPGAAKVPTQVSTAISDLQGRATELYNTFATRGEKRVAGIRKNPATEEAVQRTKTAVSQTRAARTSTRRAAGAVGKAVSEATPTENNTRPTPSSDSPRTPRPRRPGFVVFGVVWAMRYRPLGSSGLMVSVVGLGCNNFGSRVDLPARTPSSMPPWTRASTSSTRPTPTATRAVRRPCSGRCCRPPRRGRPRHQVRQRHGRDVRAGLQRPGLAPLRQESGRRLADVGFDRLHRPLPVAPSRRLHTDRGDSGGARRTRPEGKSAMSAPATWTPGRSPMPNGPRGLRERPGSSPPRTTTTCSNAAWRQSLFRRALKYGIGILPYFPLANGVLTGKYLRDEAAPPGTRLAGRQDELTDACSTAWSAGGVRQGTRPHAARRGDRRARRAAWRGLGDRRRDDGRAGARQRAAGQWQPRADDLAVLDKIAPTRRVGG